MKLVLTSSVCIETIVLCSDRASVCIEICILQCAGLLYKNNLLHIQSWLRVPNFISSIVNVSVGRLFYTPCPVDLQTPIGATVEIQRLQHIERLEQQMMWAQFSRQAAPAQVSMNLLHIKKYTTHPRPPEISCL